MRIVVVICILFVLVAALRRDSGLALLVVSYIGADVLELFQPVTAGSMHLKAGQEDVVAFGQFLHEKRQGGDHSAALVRIVFDRDYLAERKNMLGSTVSCHGRDRTKSV